MSSTSYLPLQGIRILTSRPEDQLQELALPLIELGAFVDSVSLSKVHQIDSFEKLNDVLVNINRFDWVVFTSTNGVLYVDKRVAELGMDSNIFSNVKLATVGSSTASACTKAFRVPDVVPHEFLDTEIVKYLGNLNDKKVLLLRANLATIDLPNELKKAGAEVESVICYNLIFHDPNDLPDSNPDVIVLTSPAISRNLHAWLSRNELATWFDTCKIVCIGPRTASAVNELGYKVAKIADPHTVEGLVEGVIDVTGGVCAR